VDRPLRALYLLGCCRLSHSGGARGAGNRGDRRPPDDLVSFLTYKLGWEKSYDPIDVYEGEFRAPGRPPISQQAKLYFLYPLDLAIVVFVLLPSWTKFAYCG
jgi:hypothetical protein